MNLHTMLCNRYVQSVTRCQILRYDLRECIPSSKPTKTERPQSEIRDIIVAEVCEAHNLTLPELQTKSRKKPFVAARQIISYFVCKYTDITLKSTGEFLGGQDHTTIIHSCQTVNNLRDTEPDYAHSLTQLETKIKYKL